MNGADLLCDTLLINNVDVCFANPGTSEMHFCAALDRKPQMRCILGLFEGVVTGAADGYARMAEKPAATLLHTGPGLANGLANLHNARKARSPVINVVGDHASWHLPFDAPLTSDIGSLARPMSNWVRRIGSAEGIGRDTSDAYAAAMSLPGVATLILPADMAWSDIPATAPTRATLPAKRPVAAHAVTAAAKALHSGRRAALHLSGMALRGEALTVAARIAEATGARLTAQNSNGRIERGAGRPAVGKIPYTVDAGAEFMKDIDILIRVGATEPVTFFGYPGKASRVTRADCILMELAPQETDILAALQGLADELGISTAAPVPLAAPERIDASRLSGKLTGDLVSLIVAADMPENTIICDESVSSATKFYELSQGSAPHDYLQITGGAIGIGTPLAAGAAVACPDRKVIGLQADGSALYTIQGLWTQARENLDVVTVILNNGTYGILHGEMRNVGATECGRNARRMFDLDDPAIDWIALAKGFGVEAVRATTAEEFRKALAAGLARPGPFLIDAVI